MVQGVVSRNLGRKGVYFLTTRSRQLPRFVFRNYVKSIYGLSEESEFSASAHNESGDSEDDKLHSNIGQLKDLFQESMRNLEWLDMQMSAATLKAQNVNQSKSHNIADLGNDQLQTRDESTLLSLWSVDDVEKHVDSRIAMAQPLVLILLQVYLFTGVQDGPARLNSTFKFSSNFDVWMNDLDSRNFATIPKSLVKLHEIFGMSPTMVQARLDRLRKRSNALKFLLHAKDLQANFNDSMSRASSVSGFADNSRVSIYGTETLPEGYIRLLVIKPSNGSDAELIECNLATHDMRSIPQYEALSYVWGDPNDTSDILLNGYTHKVTVNLERALRNMRVEDGKSELVLWVDALCINQANLAERGIQVSQMGNIYLNASRVRVWLGDADTNTETAAKVLDALSKDHSIHWESGSSIDRNTVCKTFSIDHGDLFLGVKRILNSPWLERVWTYQEAMLAADITMQQGRTVLTFDMIDLFDSFSKHTLCCPGISGRIAGESTAWKEFARAKRRNLPKRGHFALPPVTGMTWSHLDTEMEALRGLYASVMEKATCLPSMDQSVEAFDDEREKIREAYLSTLQLQRRIPQDYRAMLGSMATERWRRCTDPRDHVYGFAGLVPRGYGSKFRGDYTFPVEKVYEDFVLESIATLSDLDVLRLRTDADLHSKPTWSIDWRRELSYPDIWKRAQAFSSRFEMASRNEYREFQTRPGALILSGMACDEIVTSLSLPDGYHPLHVPFAWLQFMAAEIRQNTGAMLLPFFAASISGYVGGNEGLMEYFAVLKNVEDALKRLPLEPSQPIKVKRLLGCFIKTQRGRYGMAPSTTQVGDVVSVLYGGRVPFILRLYGLYSDKYRLKLTYQLVGEAFIPGLMVGEALDERDQGIVTENEFWLV